MSQAKRLLIDGRVQGVFYRESARREAHRLGLLGWVRNLPDGRVEAIVQGETHAVEQLVAWCHSGPPTARVERVEVEDTHVRDDLEDFRVRY